jgi:uncharacterized small protein (DUF1192 family)
MAIEDDDKPRKKITHEIGQDLSLLSVEELTERIALMNSEIERLQAGRHQEARVEGCGEQLFQDVGFRTRTLSPRRPCERRDHTPRPSCGRPLADFPQSHRRGYGSLRSQGRRAGVNPKLGHGRHGK